MERKDAEEIIECMGRDRTLFPYFKDRYALKLLSYYVGAGKPMHTIKQSPFGRLLDRKTDWTTPDDVNPFLLSSHYHDDETGYYDFNQP